MTVGDDMEVVRTGFNGSLEDIYSIEVRTVTSNFAANKKEKVIVID